MQIKVKKSIRNRSGHQLVFIMSTLFTLYAFRANKCIILIIFNLRQLDMYGYFNPMSFEVKIVPWTCAREEGSEQLAHLEYIFTGRIFDS